MTDFLNRRRRALTERRPVAEQVAPPVTPPASVPPVAVQERPASNISNRRATVGTELVHVTSKDPARRGLRFRNSGTTTIYLGGPGVTNETACIRILAGYLWEETLAAGAQWWALSDAAGGVLNVEEIH